MFSFEPSKTNGKHTKKLSNENDKFPLIFSIILAFSFNMFLGVGVLSPFLSLYCRSCISLERMNFSLEFSYETHLAMNLPFVETNTFSQTLSRNIPLYLKKVSSVINKEKGSKCFSFVARNHRCYHFLMKIFHLKIKSCKRGEQNHEIYESFIDN